MLVYKYVCDSVHKIHMNMHKHRHVWKKCVYEVYACIYQKRFSQSASRTPLCCGDVMLRASVKRSPVGTTTSSHAHTNIMDCAFLFEAIWIYLIKIVWFPSSFLVEPREHCSRRLSRGAMILAELACMLQWCWLHSHANQCKEEHVAVWMMRCPLPRFWDWIQRTYFLMAQALALADMNSVQFNGHPVCFGNHTPRCGSLR